MLNGMDLFQRLPDDIIIIISFGGSYSPGKSVSKIGDTT